MTVQIPDPMIIRFFIIGRMYAVARQAGGLENRKASKPPFCPRREVHPEGRRGCKPSKNDPFLVMVAGAAGNHHQK
jgi:hypothetical protein